MDSKDNNIIKGYSNSTVKNINKTLSWQNKPKTKDIQSIQYT